MLYNLYMFNVKAITVALSLADAVFPVLIQYNTHCYGDHIYREKNRD